MLNSMENESAMEMFKCFAKGIFYWTKRKYLIDSATRLKNKHEGIHFKTFICLMFKPTSHRQEWSRIKNLIAVVGLSCMCTVVGTVDCYICESKDAEIISVPLDRRSTLPHTQGGLFAQSSQVSLSNCCQMRKLWNKWSWAALKGEVGMRRLLLLTPLSRPESYHCQ